MSYCLGADAAVTGSPWQTLWQSSELAQCFAGNLSSVVTTRYVVSFPNCSYGYKEGIIYFSLVNFMHCEYIGFD